jgi:hypothetical protein
MSTEWNKLYILAFMGTEHASAEFGQAYVNVHDIFEENPLLLVAAAGIPFSMTLPTEMPEA